MTEPNAAPTVNSWDAPVVAALDRIETLPGAGPDRVEWDGFRFWGEGLPGRPMDRVTIYAFPADGSRVAFRGFADGRFEVDGDSGNLAAADLPGALGVPAETATQTVALIEPALHSSLRAYNDAHAQDPAAWRRTQQVTPSPLPRPNHTVDAPTQAQQAPQPDDQYRPAAARPHHNGPRL